MNITYVRVLPRARKHAREHQIVAWNRRFIVLRGETEEPHVWMSSLLKRRPTKAKNIPQVSVEEIIDLGPTYCPTASAKPSQDYQPPPGYQPPPSSEASVEEDKNFVRRWGSIVSSSQLPRLDKSRRRLTAALLREKASNGVVVNLLRGVGIQCSLNDVSRYRAPRKWAKYVDSERPPVTNKEALETFGRTEDVPVYVANPQKKKKT